MAFIRSSGREVRAALELWALLAARAAGTAGSTPAGGAAAACAATERARATLLAALACARAAHLQRPVPVRALAGLRRCGGGFVLPLRHRGQPVADGLTLRLQAWAAAVAGNGPDPLGWCHQVLQGHSLVWEADGPVARRAPGQRRAAGAYFTAPAVVDHLCRAALPASWRGERTLRILDPACGSGAFLQGAARLVAATPAQAGCRVVLEGWDRDPWAVHLCRINLELVQGPSPTSPTDVRRTAAGVSWRVHCRDALAAAPNGDFDIILGNPPFVASGLRGTGKVPAATQSELRRRFRAVAQYKLNTYPLFVEQALGLLRPGGRLAFVLPDSFLVGRYFSGLRERLLARAQLLELTLIREEIWTDGRVGHSVLLVARRSDGRSRPPVGPVRVQEVAALSGLAEAGRAAQVLQSDWWQPPQFQFRFAVRAVDRRLMRAVETAPGARPLGEWLRLYSGLIARAGQKSLLRSSYPTGQVAVSRQGHWLYRGVPPAENWWPCLVSGREIDRYRIQWSGERVLLEPALIKSGGRVDLYRQSKLLIRQTGDALRVALDEGGYLCLNNIHLAVAAGPTVDLRVFLAVLNSELLRRYWHLLSHEGGRLFAQIDLNLLQQVPVPAVSAAGDLYRDLISLVQRRQAVGQGPDAIALLEQELNQAVRRLYHLA